MKIRLARPLLLTASLCVLAARAEARTVVYPIPADAVSAGSEKLGLTPSPDPAKGSVDVALELSSSTDHEAVRGGLVCGAWSIQNPISTLLRAMVADHNPGGKLAPASAATPVLSIKRASTLGRCFMTGEMQGACTTRVTIDAGLRLVGSTEEIPIRAQVEREQKAVGMCDGLAVGTGLISREATIALLKDVDARLGGAVPPKP